MPQSLQHRAQQPRQQAMGEAGFYFLFVPWFIAMAYHFLRLVGPFMFSAVSDDLCEINSDDAEETDLVTEHAMIEIGKQSDSPEGEDDDLLSALEGFLPFTMIPELQSMLDCIAEEDEKCVEKTIARFSRSEPNIDKDQKSTSSNTARLCSPPRSSSGSEQNMSPDEPVFSSFPSLPAPPDSGSESDPEEFGAIPLERVQGMAKRFLAEPSIHDNSLSASETEAQNMNSTVFDDDHQSEGAEEDWADDESEASSLFVSEPEDSPVKKSPASREIQPLCIAKQRPEFVELPANEDIVLEFQREGYEALYAVSDADKRYWRKGDQFKLLTADEVAELLEWVEETNAEPVFMKPGFFADGPAEDVTSSNRNLGGPSGNGVDADETTIIEAEPCQEEQSRDDVQEGGDDEDSTLVEADDSHDDHPDEEEEDEEEMVVIQPHSRYFHVLRHTWHVNPSWCIHSGIDPNGHIYLLKMWKQQREIAAGSRIDDGSSWVIVSAPDVPRNQRPILAATGLPVPDLTITTPFGWTGYLEDRAYYKEEDDLYGEL
ncbi:hypothetical protein V8F20_011297 [Naviculisporaceae sp. PSN 640]